LRQRVYEYLADRPAGATAAELLDLVFTSQGRDPEFGPRFVGALLGGDSRFRFDTADGRWRARVHDALVRGLAETSFVVVDLEAGGGTPGRDAIIEIGAVRVENLCATSRFETLVRPPGPGPLSAAIIALTGIDDALLAPAPPAHRALAHFARWLDEARGAPWVAHNARFDSGFLRRAFAGQGARAPAVAVLCTQRLSRRLLPRLGRYNLDHVCAQFGVDNRARHRALGDADATARVWIELLGLAIARGIETIGDLLDLQEKPVRRRRRRKSRS